MVKTSTAKPSEQTGGWMNRKAGGIYYIIQCVGCVGSTMRDIVWYNRGIGMCPPKKKWTHQPEIQGLKTIWYVIPFKALVEPRGATFQACVLPDVVSTSKQMKWASWKRLQEEIERNQGFEWEMGEINTKCQCLEALLFQSVVKMQCEALTIAKEMQNLKCKASTNWQVANTMTQRRCFPLSQVVLQWVRLSSTDATGVAALTLLCATALTKNSCRTGCHTCVWGI